MILKENYAISQAFYQKIGDIVVHSQDHSQIFESLFIYFNDFWLGLLEIKRVLLVKDKVVTSLTGSKVLQRNQFE